MFAILRVSVGGASSEQNFFKIKLVASGLDFPNVPYTPQVVAPVAPATQSTGNLIREFMALSEMLGFQDSGLGNGVTYIDFLQGYGIIVHTVLPELAMKSQFMYFSAI